MTFLNKLFLSKNPIVITMIAAVCLSACVFAQAEPNKAEDFFEMSLEELMEVPVVVSAARQEQKITEASVPISIITAEDIHYSGLTSIADILRFAPGVDVLRGDRYWYDVGVRGMHRNISDRVKVLVNGRVADSALFGGPEFHSLPVLPEDVERIEIVRGPGGAAWGANAYTGVINIITKKPEDVLGYFGSTTISEFGDSFTHLRWAEKKDKWSWRISAGYEDAESSEDAIDGSASYESYVTTTLNNIIGFDNFVARDFARTWRFDAEGIYRISERTKFSLGTGYSHLEAGSFERLGNYPNKDSRHELVRSFVKIDHEFEDGSSGYLQWFGNFWNTNIATFAQFSMTENDIEAQYNFSPAKNHQMSIGGNFRWTRVRVDNESYQPYTWPDEPFDEYWAGLFGIDRWKVTDRLTLEGQIRGTWYSETQTDWSSRVSALYELDENREHILRLSAAKAFRAPLVALRENITRTILIAADTYLLNSVKPIGDLENEETWSLEAGYTGKLAKGLTLRIDGYYQDYSKLVGYRTSTVGPTVVYTPDNIDGADSWGAEIELALERKNWNLSSWYAYNEFEEDDSHQPLRTFLPAKHKAGITGRLFLSDGWVFNANYRFTNTTAENPGGSGPDVGSSNRLDLTISKSITGGKGELMFGVSDLLTKTNAGLRETGALSGHETPGRMFFARLQLKF